MVNPVIVMIPLVKMVVMALLIPLVIAAVKCSTNSGIDN